MPLTRTALMLSLLSMLAASAQAATPTAAGKILVATGSAVNLTSDDMASLGSVTAMALTSAGADVTSVVVGALSDAQLKQLAEDHGAARAVVIDATRIGESIIVLARIARGGDVRSETMSLKALGDFPVAARRLAAAVSQDKPIEETATLTTLGGEETRKYGKKAGEFLWGVGVNMGTVMTSDATFLYGTTARAAYEAPAWRLESDLSFLFNTNGHDEGGFVFDWSLGGNWIVGDGNIAPFLGGGLGLSFMDIERKDKADMDATGLSFYAGGGVEFFRYYSTRVILDARVTLPAFEVESHSWSTEGGESTESTWAPTFKTTVSLLW